MYFVLGRIFWLLLNLLSTSQQSLHDNSDNINFDTSDERTQNKLNLISHSLQNKIKVEEVPKKSKRKSGWHPKKIQFRKKNFGDLSEFKSEAGFKKVLLWTGYGPLQEGMMLWNRVLNDIGQSLAKIIKTRYANLFLCFNHRQF